MPFRKETALPRRVQALHCPARGSGLSFRDMRLLPILLIPLLVLPAPPATAQAFQIRDEDLYLDALMNMDGVQACEPRVGAAAIRSLRARLRLGEARARREDEARGWRMGKGGTRHCCRGSGRSAAISRGVPALGPAVGEQFRGRVDLWRGRGEPLGCESWRWNAAE